MAYQALYRKWRPGEFEEVKGQEQIVRTLKNQIVADRIGHAYLFCGTRGTGKTTIAKLFAKAVNCEHPVDGSPCNECASCKAIAAQTSMNVFEIDAASNSGVANVREIRDNVQYPPVDAHYKVYIIDEAHMLTKEAFNALLKTLEEPPEYVIFILATTEAQAVPMTILSRCQRYDFRRIGIATITDRLDEIMQQEHIEVAPEALRYVARMADGSMRDALSLLDRCISFHIGERVTYEHVLELLGAVDADVMTQLFRTILSHQVSELLEQIEALVMDGRELTQINNDFIWYLRNLLLLQETKHPEEIMDLSAEQITSLKEVAALTDGENLMRYIRICSELASKLKYSSQKRIDLEVAYVKLCKPQMESDVSSLKARIEELEQIVTELKEQGVRVAAQPQMMAVPQEVQEESAAPEDTVAALKEHLNRYYEPAQLADLQKIVAGKAEIVSRMKKAGYAMLAMIYEQAQITLGDQNHLLSIVVANEREHQMLTMESEGGGSLATEGAAIRRSDVIKAVYREMCGKDVDFFVRIREQNKTQRLEDVDLGLIYGIEVEIKP